MPHIDHLLLTWDSIKSRFYGSESGILLGNGASRAVWDDFRYESLYDLACNDTGRGCLSLKDQQFFAEMETKNFEAVLSALRTARIVNEILGKDVTTILERYNSIRANLINAVAAVHLPYDRMPEFNE